MTHAIVKRLHTWSPVLYLFSVAVGISLTRIDTPMARAAGFVTNCVYSGSGGLENALIGGGTVIFACSGAIVVPEITLTSDTVLDASGQQVVLSGNNSNRLFRINSDVSATFVNVTITDGNGLPNAGNGGGGVLNFGTLTLISTTVTNNTGQFNGGGINNVGTLSLVNSTVSGNVNLNSGGGGLENTNVLTLTNSTVSGNMAATAGGGIRHITGTLTLINSTVSTNTASASAGGGIVNYGGVVALANSILAYNTGAGNCQNASEGVLISNGYNLSSDYTCGLSAIGDINGQDPLLGPLQDNGGSTHTHALLPSSPAINAGGNTACPATDQRGVTRPQGGVCDMGAYEIEFPHVTFLPVILKGL